MGLEGLAVVKARATPSLNWPLVIGLISLTIAIIGIAAALHMRKGGMVEKPSFLV